MGAPNVEVAREFRVGHLCRRVPAFCLREGHLSMGSLGRLCLLVLGSSLVLIEGVTRIVRDEDAAGLAPKLVVEILVLFF